MVDPTGSIAKQLVGRHNEINGKYVDIKVAEDGKTREIVETSSCKVFVGGIEGTVSTEELRDYFQGFGEVKEAVVLKNINTNTSRGFGFVTFEDSAVANKLIRENNCVLKGKRMDVKNAEPKENSMSRNRDGMRGGYGHDLGGRGGHGYDGRGGHGYGGRGGHRDHFQNDRYSDPPQYYNDVYQQPHSSRYDSYPPMNEPAPVATMTPYAPPQHKQSYQNYGYGPQSK